MNVSDDIVVYAFRYCLGRRTYAVSDFVHEMIPKLHEISKSNRSIMLRDLDECKDFGMPMDKAEWLRFKVALEKTFE